MDISTVKKLTKYVIRWGFVDNSYWDDGNRYTNRQKTFLNFDSALEFYKEKTSRKLTKETSHVTGKTEYFRISWIQFFREITDELTPSQKKKLETSSHNSVGQSATLT